MNQLSNGCANPECKVSENGRCVEGLDLGECPHYGSEVQFTTIPESNELNLISSAAGVQLSSADTLDIAAASHLLKGLPARVVAILGTQDAGKTSLLAGLYELFQNGPVGSYWYGGSRTLHAFERASHDARIASKRTVPFTERTRLGPVHFYNLTIAHCETLNPVNLLIADRSGEMYESAVDDISNAAEFVEVQRATTLVILVDGAQLLSNRTRHHAINSAVMLVKAIYDASLLRKDMLIAVVLTKFDEIANSDDGIVALQCFDSIGGKIKSVLNGSVGDVRCFQIAASPKCKGYSVGFGLTELLEYWLQSSDNFGEITSMEKPNFERLIDQFKDVAQSQYE